MLESAVRLPTPPPGVSYSPSHPVTRKRSPPSRSPSPTRRRSPPRPDDDGARGGNEGKGRGRGREGDAGGDHVPDERERQLMARFGRAAAAARKPMTEEDKKAAERAAYEKGLNTRAGGTYIPPARLRQLQSEITDKTSKEYQRMAWEALKKSVNGLINKVNVSNIKYIVPELFGENLIRGRGLFCRSIMKAQAASLPFTPIYAAMVAIVNTKLPQVGELLLNRLIVQFRKAFRRSDKAVCISSTTFIAHLCNQQVVHEMLAAQVLLLLLHKPTDDSVEIAVGLTREVGQHLEEMNGQIALAVFDQFRHILHEADIDKRVQYMIEVLFQVRKDHYKDNPAIKEELDLVEEEDQITHRIGLDDEIDVQDGLNIFKYDDKYQEHEDAYKKLKAEILGEESGSDYESGSESDESSDEAEDEEEKQLDIKDQSNTDLVNLRRTIYLTIMSSIDFEECVHKLMKVTLPPGMEPELPSMIVECCSQERTYSKFFGLIGERLCKINRMWCDLFEEAFAKYYDTIHRYETNRLRNISRFFGHLLSSDGIGWHVMSVVHLNEDETTSSSRIFIKILFQELAEELGMAKLQERLKDPILAQSYEGLFPTDNPRNTRFSINYFTSIGMGVLTEGMREFLKTLPKPTVPALPARSPSRSRSSSVSSYSSYSSYTGSSRSRSVSGSRSPSRSRSPRRDRSRPRGRSYSRSVTPSSQWSGSRSRSRSRSYSPSRSRSRTPYSARSRSRSISPARGRRRHSTSRSRSPSPAPSRSPPPPRHRQRRASSVSRSPPRASARSITPPPARDRRRGHDTRPRERSPARRVSVSRSRSRSRSPPAPRHTSRMSYRPKDTKKRRSPSPRSPSRSITPPRGSRGRKGKSPSSPRGDRNERPRRRQASPSASPGKQRNRAKASDFL